MQDDTVNAAAVVLTAAARSNTGLLHHHRQVDDHPCAASKRRWWSRVKAKLLCFGASHGNPRRIADASPEPLRQNNSNSYCTHHATRPATVAFAAPPPSPASSLLTSGSPSPMTQVLRLDASSSPTTASIFAIGPYAREPQQLVSPPAFSASAGLTEPSTAPLTPPPEPACGGLQLLAAGSSPEVPFARFLSPSFQGYQLQPGSPIGGTLLVSPASTSSSPPAWLHRRNEEGPTLLEEGCSARRAPSGEFVFGSAACERTFADGEEGGRRASISMADDADEAGNQQWPFRSSFPS